MAGEMNCPYCCCVDCCIGPGLVQVEDCIYKRRACIRIMATLFGNCSPNYCHNADTLGIYFCSSA